MKELNLVWTSQLGKLASRNCCIRLGAIIYKKLGCNYSSPLRGAPWVTLKSSSPWQPVHLQMTCQSHTYWNNAIQYSLSRLGDIIRICSLNIEGMSRSKCQVLPIYSKIIVLKPKVQDELYVRVKTKLPGYDVIEITYHRK